MKKFYFLPLAFAGLLLTGCSSDDATAPTDGHVTNLAEGGYVSLAINLPTQNANVSRAANDNFAEGLTSEYDVKSAKLLLFQKTGDVPEGDATFHSAYDLHFTPIKEGKPQVTVTSKIVKKLTDTPKPQKLYALVVLNDGGLITGATEEGAVENVKIGTTSLTENTKFSDIQKLTLDGDKYKTTDGLLMLNAPLMVGGVATDATAPAGPAQTLAEVTNQVFNTEAKAQAAPAANVYVERSAAKVTFTSSLKENVLKGEEYTDKGNNGATVPVKITGWALNVTNKKAYLVHNVEGFDTWKGLKSDSKATTMRTGASAFRFAGTSSLYNVPANGGNSGEKGKDLYRIYWGEDPNYSTADPKSDELKANFTTLTPEEKTAFTNKFGDENPKYCNENTFNVAAQNKNQTTSIIVQAQVGDGHTDYYVVNNDKSRLYMLGKLDTLVNSILIGKSITKAGENATITYTKRDANTGKVSVASFSYTSDGETKNGTLEEVASVNQTLGEVTEYVEGKTYYSIPIKHFGDDLTPWGPNENNVASDKVYPAKDQDAWYLGRYGVLRNNWYDVAVTSIRALGSAVVPTPDNTPDDDYDNYLSFRINVLSWAKRSQSVDL